MFAAPPGLREISTFFTLGLAPQANNYRASGAGDGQHAQHVRAGDEHALRAASFLSTRRLNVLSVRR